MHATNWGYCEKSGLRDVAMNMRRFLLTKRFARSAQLRSWQWLKFVRRNIGGTGTIIIFCNISLTIYYLERHDVFARCMRYLLELTPLFS